MNISKSTYSNDELLYLLKSNKRVVYYEYLLFDMQGKALGYLDIGDGRVSFDYTADVMRTFSGNAKKTDLLNSESTDYVLNPWMCLKINDNVVKWSLGKFLISPSESYQDNLGTISLTGYDFGKIALDDKSETRIFASADTVYTSLALQIAGTDYDSVEIESSNKAIGNVLEWEIGTEKLVIINDLLKSINYNPLHFDENGSASSEPHIVFEEREIERIYQANETSIIVDGITKASDKFDIPNKFIRYVENPDAAYLISIYVNDAEDNPFSTVNRGRVIVDSDSVDDIATQADLDAYTIKIATEKMMSTETLEFSTLNMPGHGYANCLYVDIPKYDISGKYIEVGWEMDLTVGGLMKHRCQRV